MLLPIGTAVVHSGHGPGTIVCYNQRPEIPAYVLENQEALNNAAKLGLLTPNCFYDNSRYPYVVQFDSGYKDVYSPNDITVKE